MAIGSLHDDGWVSQLSWSSVIVCRKLEAAFEVVTAKSTLDELSGSDYKFRPGSRRSR
jgi:hypothetical protein